MSCVTSSITSLCTIRTFWFFSKSVAEHECDVCLQQLLESHLYVKGKKCEIHVESVSFLGLHCWKMPVKSRSREGASSDCVASSLEKGNGLVLQTFSAVSFVISVKSHYHWVRWALFFTRFNLILTYRPSSRHVKHKVLSQQFDTSDNPWQCCHPPVSLVCSLGRLITNLSQHKRKIYMSPWEKPHHLFSATSISRPFLAKHVQEYISASVCAEINPPAPFLLGC